MSSAAKKKAAKRKPRQRAVKERINPALLPLVRDLSSLKEDDENPRLHDERNLNAIREMLSVHNQDGKVLAGNARLHVMRRMLGWKRGAVLTYDGGQEDHFRVGDNQVGTLGSWSEVNLGLILSRLEKEDRGLYTGIGFDDQELHRLCASLGAGVPKSLDPRVREDWRKEWGGMPGYENSDLRAVKSVLVHFHTLEDMEAFARLVEQQMTVQTRSIWYPKEPITRIVDKRYEQASETEAAE